MAEDHSTAVVVVRERATGKESHSESRAGNDDHATG